MSTALLRKIVVLYVRPSDERGSPLPALLLGALIELNMMQEGDFIE